MDNSKHLEDIKDIKKMMDRATKFSSLSGFSIVIAGLMATSRRVSYLFRFRIFSYMKESL